MDARDIQEQVPVVENGKYLEEIYNLQGILISKYTQIEKLPNPPIDVNTKSSQVLIKDFVGRVIEELGEGYESMILIDQAMEHNNLFMSGFDKNACSQTINHLQNVSEEFADAMHFMVELLIYINILPEDIQNFLVKELGSNIDSFASIHDISKEDTLNMSMAYGLYRHSTIYGNFTEYLSDYKYRNILHIAEDNGIHVTDTKLYTAAVDYNHILYMDIKKCMWDVTYHLNIARNFLKNKPWKQSQMMTDEIHFQNEIALAFFDMMGLFCALSLDSDTLFHIYFKKNMTNRFRIESKY